MPLPTNADITRTRRRAEKAAKKREEEALLPPNSNLLDIIPIPFTTPSKYDDWNNKKLKQEAVNRELVPKGERSVLIKRLRMSDERPGVYCRWNPKELETALADRGISV